MTPTHKLVSIDKLDKICCTCDDELEKLLNDSPEVDLSKEGIAIKCHSHTSNGANISNAYFTKGYEACAKDLLNTK